MTMVWVTGSPGVGKSTVCTLLKARHELAVDADWEGFNHWVERASGQVVADPPYPVPAGWLERYAWWISRAEVEALVERTHDQTAFLFGSVENECDVWDLLDRVVCLVADNATLQNRLLSRTTNEFGKHPEELAAAAWLELHGRGEVPLLGRDDHRRQAASARRCGTRSSLMLPRLPQIEDHDDR